MAAKQELIAMHTGAVKEIARFALGMTRSGMVQLLSDLARTVRKSSPGEAGIGRAVEAQRQVWRLPTRPHVALSCSQAAFEADKSPSAVINRRLRDLRVFSQEWDGGDPLVARCRERYWGTAKPQ